MGWAAAALLAVALAASAADRDRAGVVVRLVPVDDPVAVQCDFHDLEAALQKRIAKSDRLRLATEGEEPRVSVRVLECGVVQDSHVDREEGRQPLKIPTEKGGIAFGGETVIGVGVRTQAVVVLRARATWEDGAEELEAIEKGRSLDNAARVVVGRLDRLVERWGLAPRNR